MSEAPADEPFFIVGCPRSGTTLLAVLVDRHSRLCVPPETAFFDEVAPDLPVSSDGLLRILSGWPRLAELGLRAEDVATSLSGNEASPQAVLGAILKLYAHKRGKRRCGEKTPQHLWRAGQIGDAFPRSCVIALLRDGRENALSLNRMPWWDDGLVGAADLWRRAVGAIELLERSLGDRFLLVRYERLVREPAGELARVMALLGETFEPSQLDPATPSGVVMSRSLEWKGKALRAVDPRAAGCQTRAALPADLSLLESLLGEDLRRMSY